MKIALLGDIAPFGRYCLAENKGLTKHFASVSGYLAEFDIVIGNLETPFIDDERPLGAKSAHVKSHPANVELLSELGITHVTLANNHIGDFGLNGYQRTKATLEKAGIGWFGTENKQIKIQNADEKVALMGYCSYNTNPSAVNSGSEQGLNYLEVESVLKVMNANAENGYVSVLAVHSGQEHIHMPSSDDVAFARGLARKFSYVYYGHHPHVIQGHEVIGNSAIYYSLGNFIFDDVYTARDPERPLIRLSEENKTGAIGVVEVKGSRVSSADVIPIYMGLDRMLIGDEVSDFNMQDYNAPLCNAGTHQYDQQRNSIIANYISSRREMRDLKWYMRRLNLNSIGIILKARKNTRLYRSVFSSKLKLLEGD